jgi:hypothetical protein
MLLAIAQVFNVGYPVLGGPSILIISENKNV